VTKTERRKYQRNWYKKNSAKRCEEARKYYRVHRRKRLKYKAEWRKRNIEYISVQGHYHNIFDRRNPKNRNYRGMPFFKSWNPKKGGSLRTGADWIVDNLGKRPKGCTLHIIDHKKGFVPGNLAWTSPRNQNYQQMVKIIGRLKHQIQRLKKQVRKLKSK